MSFSTIFGAFASAQNLKILRRVSAVVAFVWGIFSVLAFDLVRHDAIFSPNFVLATATSGQPNLEAYLLNTAAVPMDNLNAHFQFYAADGSKVLMDADNDKAFTVAEQVKNYFVPLGMTIGPNSSKFGLFLPAQIEGGFDPVQSVWICAIHKGSFWIDQVRSVYVLKRMADDMTFGQTEYKKNVFFFTQPKCDPPETQKL